MAILYIGPKRNPDFETDYYISPVLSPPHLLEDFPPVYLICGERDPFVDDTIIFAGKLREAKRSRRAAAEAAQRESGKKDDPDHILRETDDDWVQMRIIEGWGHGFMQMSALMREVNSVLVEMADWIDESFERHDIIRRDVHEVAAARRAASAAGVDEYARPEEHIPPPVSTHVKPVGSYKPSTADSVLGGADLGAPLASDLGEDEEEGQITFTPKTKRRQPPPSRFTPVPRRPSKERLLHRSDSAPKFDLDPSSASPSEPPTPEESPAEAPRGSGAFAFFTSRSSAPSKTATPPSAFTSAPSTPGSLFGQRRPSNSQSSAPPSKPTNSLVAAAVAGARAASPALAAAGLVPQSVESLSEAEIMRRRRLEAVLGLGETVSEAVSDEEEDEDDEEDEAEDEEASVGKGARD